MAGEYAMNLLKNVMRYMTDIRRSAAMKIKMSFPSEFLLKFIIYQY